MASIPELQIVIIGAGRSVLGLRLLNIIARIFGIRLELVVPKGRKDGTCFVAPHCEHGYNGHCPECDATRTPPQQAEMGL